MQGWRLGARGDEKRRGGVVDVRVRTGVIRFWLGLLSLLCGAVLASGLEHVELKQGEQTVAVSGKVLVEAQDGGLLLLAQDGILWVAQPDEIVRRTSDEIAFEPLDGQAVAQRLLEELPPGFRIHQTANYVICYNTSDAYAEWCGGLYERLYRAFYSFWKNRGLTLSKSEFPLVALVFNDQNSFAQYARTELGDATSSIIGYYNMRSNRVTMYDLTGMDGLRERQRGVSSAVHINQILSQPAAERTVATIVHEATHQLAHNSGLQTRLAGNPTWVSEGIAVYFETPDLASSKGWRNIGTVNRLHLHQFQQALDRRPENSLISLLTDDGRFRDPRTSAAAYAEAWAWNYFLLRKRREHYVAYLQDLARLKPLSEVPADQRLSQFRSAFGDDLEALDQEFVRYMRKVR